MARVPKVGLAFLVRRWRGGRKVEVEVEVLMQKNIGEGGWSEVFLSVE